MSILRGWSALDGSRESARNGVYAQPQKYREEHQRYSSPRSARSSGPMSASLAAVLRTHTPRRSILISKNRQAGRITM